MSSPYIFSAPRAPSPVSDDFGLDIAREIDNAIEAELPKLKKIHPSMNIEAAATKKLLEPHAGVVADYLDALVRGDLEAQAQIFTEAYARVDAVGSAVALFVRFYMHAMLPYSGLVEAISQELEVQQCEDDDQTALDEATEKAGMITFSDDPASLDTDKFNEEIQKYDSYDVLVENITDVDASEEDKPVDHLFRVVAATPNTGAELEKRALFKAFDNRDMKYLEFCIRSDITAIVALAAVGKVVPEDVRQKHLKNSRDYVVGRLMAVHLVQLRKRIRAAEQRAAQKTRRREEEADDGGRKRRAVCKSP